ncbi:hypothetical protein, partial [Micromonospora sp. LOL_024]|uniref:hypothetical protein n=1 Tax=Micromonospora sp. LOL_024 TaxID=3345412 RepID=UPI003A8638C5
PGTTRHPITNRTFKDYSGALAASPDDPALTDYWAQRRGKNLPLLDRSILILLAKQKGRCALCQGLLLHADHEPHSQGLCVVDVRGCELG